MILDLRSAALAVVTVAATAWAPADPHIFTMEAADGRRVEWATTTLAACLEQAAALRRGISVPDGWTMDDIAGATMACSLGDGFAPGWRCIEGFNCR